MSDQCNNKPLLASNVQLQALCACEIATDNFVKLTDTYQNNYTSYNTRLADYTKKSQQYDIDHSSWNSKFDDYTHSQKNITKEWSNCVDGSACNVGHDDWCKNDLGQDYVDARQCVQSNCGLYRKGLCKLSDSALNDSYASWKKNNAEPIAPDYNDVGNVPSAPSNNNIQCCSQLFSNISSVSGSVNVKDVVQQCTQNITSAISGINSAVSPVVSPVVSAVSSGDNHGTVNGTGTTGTTGTAAGTTETTGTTGTVSIDSLKNKFNSFDQNTQILLGVSCSLLIIILLYIIANLI